MCTTTRPADFSTLRCWETAGRLTSIPSAISRTDRLPLRTRRNTARRVGSPSASNARSIRCEVAIVIMMIEPVNRAGWCRKHQLTVSLNLLHLRFVKRISHGQRNQNTASLRQGGYETLSLLRCRIHDNALVQTANARTANQFTTYGD